MSGSAPVVVPPDVAEFLAKGLIMYFGSRGPDLTPECVLAAGARVEDGGAEITVWVPEIFAAAGSWGLSAGLPVRGEPKEPLENRPPGFR